jgi:hypothetical protein
MRETSGRRTTENKFVGFTMITNLRQQHIDHNDDYSLAAVLLTPILTRLKSIDVVILGSTTATYQQF